MRRLSGLVEFISLAIILLLGSLSIYQSFFSDMGLSSTIALVAGAILATAGLLGLFVAIRSVMWHRKMMKQSPPYEHTIVASSFQHQK
jgi:hypothetical protein